jgi:hypothetical protein
MFRHKSDLILAGHAFLAGSMALWRAVEGTPWLTSKRGSGLLGHPAGEALLAAWMLVAVATLVGVVVGTIVERRLSLFIPATLLVASLSVRTGFDAFDLAYLLTVPVAIVLHVDRRHGENTEGRGARTEGRGASTGEGDTLGAG